MLEPGSARRWSDPCLLGACDLSAVNWIACANITDPLPKALLSRFRIVELAMPEQSHFDAALTSVLGDLADRLVDRLVRTTFTEDDRKFIEEQRMFFLATTDADGFPDCSYKGGDPGFVRVLDERTLVFPSYDGNGMFKSLGNIRANPAVGLLFISFERPNRLRVSASANGGALPGECRRAAYLGSRVEYVVGTPWGELLVFDDAVKRMHARGSTLGVMFDPEAAIVLPRGATT